MPVLRSNEYIGMQQIQTRMDKGTNTYLIVRDLEQDQLSGAKRIEEPQGHGGDHRAEEAVRAVKDCGVGFSWSHTFST